MHIQSDDLTSFPVIHLMCAVSPLSPEFTAWVQFLAPPFTGCEASGKGPHLSTPQFPHL